MKFNEILTESASAIVYHFAPLYNAMQIMKQKRFGLTADIGTSLEKDMRAGDRWYYLSTARERTAQYTKSGAYWTGVVFTLNGNWLNHNHKSKPVDYWARMWLSTHGVGHGVDVRTREAEDRIFSTKPYINFPPNPSDLVKEVHVLLRRDDKRKNDREAQDNSMVRSVLIAAKTNGIPAYLYFDHNAWLIQNKGKAVPITNELMQTLKGDRPNEWFSKYHLDDPFEPWRELFYKNRQSDLSEKANKLRHSLVYYGDTSNQLANEFHNGKKTHRDEIAKTLKVFKLAKVHSVKDYCDAMAAKWKEITRREYDEKKA